MNITENENQYGENDSIPFQQYNIIEEMIQLEQQMKDPNNKTFKKTTYWNQLNNTVNNEENENLLKEIIDRLIRIENKLTNIE